MNSTVEKTHIHIHITCMVDCTLRTWDNSYDPSLSQCSIYWYTYCKIIINNCRVPVRCSKTALISYSKKFVSWTKLLKLFKPSVFHHCTCQRERKLNFLRYRVELLESHLMDLWINGTLSVRGKIYQFI